MTATQVADRELNRVLAAGQGDSPTGTHSRFWNQDFPYPGQAFRTGTTKVGNHEFKYSVYSQTVPNVGDPTFNRLKKVDVYVGWWEGQNREGYGRLETHSYRLFNQGEIR